MDGGSAEHCVNIIPAAVYKQELKEVSRIATSFLRQGVMLVDLAHREFPTSLSYRKSNQCYKTPRIFYTRLPTVP